MIQSTGVQQNTNPYIHNQYQAREVYSRQENGPKDVSERLIGQTTRFRSPTVPNPSLPTPVQ